MSQSLHGYIQKHGFEATVDDLIDYAETQARFHQALGDRQQWEFWVKRWVTIQQTGQSLAHPPTQNWLEIWQQHIASAHSP